MYFFFVATISEGMLSSGVVQHFRKFIDQIDESYFEIQGTKQSTMPTWRPQKVPKMVKKMKTKMPVS